MENGLASRCLGGWLRTSCMEIGYYMRKIDVNGGNDLVK